MTLLIPPAPLSTAATTAPTTLPVMAIGAPRLLRGLDRLATVGLADHVQLHGPLPTLDRGQLITLTRQAQLTGRGGAGFPFADKLTSVATTATPVVVVNGSESEPASWKDRILMRGTPHLVLDGALIVARALGAKEVLIGVHDRLSAERLRSAVAERRDRMSVKVQQSDAAFIVGEARSLMQSLSGKPAVPSGRKVHPTISGVNGAPTLMSNVETFAQLAVLARLGVHRFSETGAADEPGTTLLSVGGAVGRPSVMEVPTGTPLSIVLAASNARADLQAVILGGYHGSWHQPIGAIRLSRAGVHHAGGTLGAGVVLALGSDTCALGELHRATGWLAAQSAQQCGPCMFGLPALAQDVARVFRGERDGVELALRHARAVTGRGACAHPDGAARFVVSAIHALPDEMQAHSRAGGCGRPVVGVLPL